MSQSPTTPPLESLQRLLSFASDVAPSLVFAQSLTLQEGNALMIEADDLAARLGNTAGNTQEFDAIVERVHVLRRTVDARIRFLSPKKLQDWQVLCAAIALVPANKASSVSASFSAADSSVA